MKDVESTYLILYFILLIIGGLLMVGIYFFRQQGYEAKKIICWYIFIYSISFVKFDEDAKTNVEINEYN